MTICADCKHYIKKGSEWYDMYCGAKKAGRYFDPVTGKTYEEELPFCRDRNKGSCKLFKKKVGRPRHIVVEVAL